MKAAHWARVTKALRDKYQLDHQTAKRVYDRLKVTEGRKPSLRMVTGLPDRLPKKKGFPQKPAKGESSLNLPKGVKLAPPPPPPPVPRHVPKRQSARNTFERMLREKGLPVSAIARDGLGQALVKYWRQPEKLEKITELLKRGYKQIDRDGRMKPTTATRLEKELRALMGDYDVNAGNLILKQLYGVAPR